MRDASHRSKKAMQTDFRPPLAAALVLLAGIVNGCNSAADWREEADTAALGLIENAQTAAFGRSSPFSIDRPAETLRRRLLLDQDLPRTAQASLGPEEVGRIDHWPEDDGPGKTEERPEDLVDLSSRSGESLELSLTDALRVAARNSRDYQTQKEDVFRAALALDLSANDFRNQLQGVLSGEVQADLGRDELGNRTRTAGLIGNSELSLSRAFQSGVSLTSRIGIDVVRLLTPDALTGERSRSYGIYGDTSITIPLMRGAGRHIVAEPLIQSERDTLYAILRFERFKRTFAVTVVSQYLGVLQQIDQINNAEQNYKSLVSSAAQLRRLADAGRRPELEVDQAVQNELSSRDRWVGAIQSYKRQLDNFRVLLGLPTDAEVVLDRSELAKLAERVKTTLGSWAAEDEPVASPDVEAGDQVMVRDAIADIVLPPPGRGNKGPWELDERTAAEIALERRLDLAIAEGTVYDSQRRLVIAADRLRGEVTLGGSASFGERRSSLGSATLDDAEHLRSAEAFYSALLTVDLPLQRVAERNQYRNTWIELDRAVRDLQELEDQVKADVRTRLRSLLEAREGLSIQAKAVRLADRRVGSTTLFLDAGRAQTRDLLEAQEALISAQNDLTSALIAYRIAELELQRDMDVLQVDEDGLWSELDPEELTR